MEILWQMSYVRQGLPKMNFQQNVIISFPVTAKESYFERLLYSDVFQLKMIEKMEKMCL